MSELLRCPFCGSGDISSGEIMGMDIATGVDFAQNVCDGCGACGPYVDQAEGMDGPGLVDAADAAWNRRSPAGAPAGVSDEQIEGLIRYYFDEVAPSPFADTLLRFAHALLSASSVSGENAPGDGGMSD